MLRRTIEPSEAQRAHRKELEKVRVAEEELDTQEAKTIEAIAKLPPKEATEFLEFCYAQVAFEHSLINNRMNWYVTCQSFLITAFAISMNVQSDWFKLIIHGIICGIGVSTTLFTTASIQAARGVLQQWRNNRLDELKKRPDLKHYFPPREGFQIKLGADGKPQSFLTDLFDTKGNTSIIKIPGVFFISWILISLLTIWLDVVPMAVARIAPRQPAISQPAVPRKSHKSIQSPKPRKKIIPKNTTS